MWLALVRMAITVDVEWWCTSYHGVMGKVVFHVDAPSL